MNDRVVNETEAAGMRSPLGWALLSLLIERQSYGYELVQRFERVYGDTLVLSSRSYIYKLLDLLCSHSLIEEVRDGASDLTATGRPTPHFRATAQGVSAYKDWLVAQLAEERHRQQLFARQLGMLEPEAALAVVEHYEQECLEEATEAATEKRNEPPVDDATGIAKRLAAEDERLALGVRLSWSEYARRELKTLIEERAKEQ